MFQLNLKNPSSPLNISQTSGMDSLEPSTNHLATKECLITLDPVPRGSKTPSATVKASQESLNLSKGLSDISLVQAPPHQSTKVRSFVFQSLLASIPSSPLKWLLLNCLRWSRQCRRE